MKAVPVVCLVFIILVSGCVQKPETQEVSSQTANEPEAVCVELCKQAIESGENLDSGPCLSDGNPNWKIDDWVCDVAHIPRRPIDDLSANQCQEYRRGEARHFVEVSPNCELIRAV